MANDWGGGGGTNKQPGDLLGAHLLYTSGRQPVKAERAVLYALKLPHADVYEGFTNYMIKD